MAAKKFHIATPEDLKSLSPLVKEGKLDRIIGVWMAARSKRGETRWDKSIYVGFSGDRHKNAEIVRFSADGEIVYCATLQYNKALNWCEQHLRQVYA